MSDPLIGGIILVCSLLILCGCLIGIVKVLNSVLRGKNFDFFKYIIIACILCLRF